jgi:hypothetical protein
VNVELFLDKTHFSYDVAIQNRSKPLPVQLKTTKSVPPRFFAIEPSAVHPHPFDRKRVVSHGLVYEPSIHGRVRFGSGSHSWQADNGVMAHRADCFQRHVAA